MKNYAFLFLLFFSGALMSQSTQVTPQIGLARFFRINPDNDYTNPGSFTKTLELELGYIQHTDKVSFFFFGGSSFYTGIYEEGSYSSAGGTSVKGDFANITLDIGAAVIHPLVDKLELSYGLMVSTVFFSNYTGTRSNWTNHGSDAGINRTELTENPGKKVVPLLQLGLAYPISISEKFQLIPGIQTSVGLINEYNTYRRSSIVFSVGTRHTLK